MLVVGKVTPQYTVLFLHNVLRSLGVDFFFLEISINGFFWFAKICVPNWWVKSNVTFNIHLSFFLMFQMDTWTRQTSHLASGLLSRRDDHDFVSVHYRWIGLEGSILVIESSEFFRFVDVFFFALLDAYYVYILLYVINHS